MFDFPHERLDGGPLSERRDHALTWSGTELVVWGGDPGDAHAPFADGAAYEPETGIWRSLTASPLSARTRHSAVWYGERMFVWGGFGSLEDGAGDTRMRGDGAFYDPVSDSWEEAATAPEARASAHAVVVGDVVVIAGGSSDADGASVSGFLVYEPGGNAWETVPWPSGEGVRIHALERRGDSAVALGTRDGVPLVAAFVPGSSGVAERSWDDYASPAASVGLVSDSDGLLFGIIRDDDRTRLLEVAEDGAPVLRAETEGARFRPPVSMTASPLSVGRLYAAEDGRMIATGDGDVSVWDLRNGTSVRGQGGALGGYCGPFVLVEDSRLLGWGGLDCALSGIDLDLGT
ncbi:hypothetical protein [Nocardiopsis sp. B62]|uniref:Kelch repeat-containing protein n=1 Tax=Nocardiopsis sp. B62 TaxID=2824874 RepID=UPI001B382124|nr:hypothetical protein [Nocardiopsis sp. B62]MBQ1081066.1 hypothetical protein [Nocardiopsis sp. B62]